MAQPPSINIPSSTSTVDVSIINTTSSIRGIKTWNFVSPPIKGHDWLVAPAFSFLVQHRDSSSSRRLIFDLGIRKDWWNLSPFLQQHFKAAGYEINVDKSVREILESNGVDCSDGQIEAIFWSHWHWDHTGNPSEFPTSTQLIVGPGFKAHLLPGYPKNQESMLQESDWDDRDLVELDFDKDPRGGFKIGRFKAIDYFRDGSFYLLDSPGHAIGHVCGLARVTSNPDSFIFMGGDAAHHGAEMRPSPFLPLPDEITPHPFAPVSMRTSPCPGAMFEGILPGADQEGHHGDRTKPFYTPAKLEVEQIHHDVDEAIRTIEKIQEYDGQRQENILVVVAHDASLLDIIDFFPKTANDFMKKGWVQEARWRFLQDFAEAVGWEGNVECKRDWFLQKAEERK